MTMYVFRCRSCGPFDAAFPIGSAPAKVGCPQCSSEGDRVFSAPRIGRSANGYSRAIERSAASADRPEVVTSLPGAARRPTPITRNPLHAKLPRP